MDKSRKAIKSICFPCRSLFTYLFLNFAHFDKHWRHMIHRLIHKWLFGLNLREKRRAVTRKTVKTLTPADPCHPPQKNQSTRKKSGRLAFHRYSVGGLSVFHFRDITNVVGCFPSSTNCVRNAYLHDVTWTCHTSWVGIVEDTTEALKQSTITNCLTNEYYTIKNHMSRLTCS